MTPFEQGRQAGRNGKRTERGLMIFGLSCAADAETARLTQDWLRGFVLGEAEMAPMPTPGLELGSVTVPDHRWV